MRIPSLVRLPKYSKFNFEPRYYDPVKEDIKNRTEKIKAELEAGEKISPNDRARFRAEMNEVFSRRSSQDRQSSVMQVVFILLFVGLCAGYLFYGNNVLYAALIIVPMYILYRKRSFGSKKE